MARIGEVARQFGIAVETIRLYEREGVILLDKTEKGQRLFTPEDIRWIECIRGLIREQRLNIEGIRRLLSMMPCWEMRPCSPNERRHCPAFQGALRPCWTMKSDIPVTCRDKNCRDCNVYRGATHCGNLKKVVHRL